MFDAIRNLIRIGSVKLVKSGKTQTLQVATTAEELLDNVKYIEPYGFTSHPNSGAECIVVNVGANNSNPIALVCGGRAFRLQDLSEGEVAIYTDEGDKIVFKRGKTIEITTTTLKITGNVEVSGKFDVVGNITSAADVSDKTSNLTTIRSIFDAHQHTGNAQLPTSDPLTKMGA